MLSFVVRNRRIACRLLFATSVFAGLAVAAPLASAGTVTIFGAIRATSGAPSVPGPPTIDPGVTGSTARDPGLGHAFPAATPLSQQSTSTNLGLDAKWGDPLSADLLDSSVVHARLRYYSDASGRGAQEGFGITFTLPN